MKKEYDFSKAEQGKFYCKPENMKIPVYLDSVLESFYSERARKRKVNMGNQRKPQRGYIQIDLK